jgi:membrane fusion protein (multidrug efflux system)
MPLRALVRYTLFALGVVLVLIGGFYFYLKSSRYPSTDNAFVKAYKVTMAPEVAGRLKALHVKEYQRVHKGDVLLEIDPETYEIAYRNALATLESTKTQIEALRQTYYQRQSELNRIHRDIAFYRREYERQKSLVARNFTSRTQFDTAEHDLRTAEENKIAAEHAMAQILATLNGDVNNPFEKIPLYQRAKAGLDRAALDLRRCVIQSPIDGITTQVSEIREGDYLNIGTPVFSVVEIDRPWVEANYKEDQLTHVRPGQDATFVVDMYPNVVWHGVIENLAPASGAEFALLPPENYSGNWVKVVQRIPVRIAINPLEHPLPLRSGMMAVVKIDTQHHPKIWPF